MRAATGMATENYDKEWLVYTYCHLIYSYSRAIHACLTIFSGTLSEALAKVYTANS